MISEGSCDTETWSNDAENSALHFNICWKIGKFHNISVFAVFCINFVSIV